MCPPRPSGAGRFSDAYSTRTDELRPAHLPADNITSRCLSAVCHTQFLDGEAHTSALGLNCVTLALFGRIETCTNSSTHPSTDTTMQTERQDGLFLVHRGSRDRGISMSEALLPDVRLYLLLNHSFFASDLVLLLLF